MKNEKEEKKTPKDENLRSLVGKMKKLQSAIEDYIDNMELDEEDDKEAEDGKRN